MFTGELKLLKMPPPLPLDRLGWGIFETLDANELNETKKQGCSKCGSAGAEIILGIPPLRIQIKVHSIKHFLKILNSPVPNDIYKKFINETYDQ